LNDAAAPAPADKRWRALLIGLTVVIAATRFFALSHSLWDWDETLFCLALDHYDVSDHRPHPPGFPLFILIGKILRFLVHDNFRALRTENLLFAIFGFPSFYAMARGFGFTRRVAVWSAVLFCFLPNVWYYGGTAFSDLPTLILIVGATAALMHGRSDRRLYFAGSFLYGVAMTFRPQSLIAGWPWLVASWDRWRQRKSDVVIASVLTSVVVIGAYSGAMLLTGTGRYWFSVNAHRHWVMTVDTYHNTTRPPSISLFYPFVIDPYQAGRISLWLGIAAAIGILFAVWRRERAAGHAVLTFGPSLVFALFMLGPQGSSRLSLSYMPLLPLLAVYGVVSIGELIAKRARIAGQVAVWVVMLLIIGRLIQWTLPSLREVRRHDSPPVEAMRWARRNVPPGDTIYVNFGLDPQTRYLLGGRNVKVIDNDRGLIQVPQSGHNWYLCDCETGVRDAQRFIRPRKMLFALFQRRYFEASIQRVIDFANFEEGWYEGENSGGDSWRWMGRHSRTLLPPMPGKADLVLRFEVPLDAEAPPDVEVRFNGVEIDHARADKRIWERTYVVDSRADRANELAIDVDHAVRPPSDSRELGLSLRSWTWKAHR